VRSLPRLEVPDGAVTFSGALELALRGRTTTAERLVKEAVKVVEGFVEEDAGHDGIVRSSSEFRALVAL